VVSDDGKLVSQRAKWNILTRELTHSSRTKNRQAVSSNLPVEMRSSSRPGVPTTMSIYKQQSMNTSLNKSMNKSVSQSWS